jgi:hypothetical protein
MRNANIGRVLVASLHQGIADLLPSRLGFYENWLHAEGLREGTIGVAPLYAVLSFLREEGGTGGDAYRSITSRAGAYAAEWTVDAMTDMQRSMLRATPAGLRSRLVLRLARRVVRACSRQSVATARLRGSTAHVDVHASIFCTVREPMSYPLCGFYAATFSTLLEQFGVPADAQVVACRGTGEPSCRLTVRLQNGAAR